MKILCIAPHVPWPLHGGPQIRIYHTGRVLDAEGHDVMLLAGHPEDEALPDLSQLQVVFEEIDTFATSSASRKKRLLGSLLSLDPYPARTFGTAAYRQSLADLLYQDWDLILVNHLILVAPLREVGPPDVPVILDQHESEVEIWEEYARRGSLPERLFALQNLPKVRRARNRAWPVLDGVVCVAPEEIRELEALVPGDVQLYLAPNGVDTDRMTPGEAPPMSQRGPNLVFCAGMAVERNVQAALWLAEEVLPTVRSEVPDATFWIVGADPPDRVRALEERDGIEVTGTVPDVRPYYEKARVAVIPNRFGGFSKLKLSEAMAMGLPIVATKSGAKGAPAGGDLIQTAEGSQAFADAVIRVLRDDGVAEELGAKGRRLAERELTWQRIIGDLESRIKRTILSESESSQRPAREVLP